MRKFFVLSFALLVIITSCSSHIDKRNDSEFVKQLQDPNVKDLNESLSLRLDPLEINSQKVGDLIYLEVINKSERGIFIPPGSTIQLFQIDNQGKTWIKVKDFVNHYGEGITTLPEGKDSISSAPLVVNPMIESPKEEAQVRIAVTGFFVENDEVTAEPATAFLDLKLTAP